MSVYVSLSVQYMSILLEGIYNEKIKKYVLGGRHIQKFSFGKFSQKVQKTVKWRGQLWDDEKGSKVIRTCTTSPELIR